MQIRKDAIGADEISQDLKDGSCLSSDDESSMQLMVRPSTPKPVVAVDTVANVTKYFSTLFDGMMQKKRKHPSEEEYETPAAPLLHRPIKPLPIRTPSIQSWHDMFQTSINYTFMTFPQLESIKNDLIIPESKILQSYWLQTKLLTQKHSMIPPFRFSRTFRNIAASFESGESLFSEPLACCGIQYRLLLSREGDVLKALLQKSKESSTISYELYCVDHRSYMNNKQLLDLMVPVTKCDYTGAGHAYGIPLYPVKVEDGPVLDEICLVATISFQ